VHGKESGLTGKTRWKPKEDGIARLTKGEKYGGGKRGEPLKEREGGRDLLWYDRRELLAWKRSCENFRNLWKKTKCASGKATNYANRPALKQTDQKKGGQRRY